MLERKPKSSVRVATTLNHSTIPSVTSQLPPALLVGPQSKKVPGFLDLLTPRVVGLQEGGSIEVASL